MKKALSLILSALIAVSGFAFGVSAKSAAPTVYLTLSDNTAALRLKQEPITVTDVDSDNKLTINDVLYIAHENFFEGGAAAGFASSDAYGYGLGIDKLWGQTNNGGFGYYLNNNMCMNLEETVKNGDYINAYCYQDTENWSDRYSYFDKNNATVDVGESVSLELISLSYYDGNTYTDPTPYAEITINDTATENITGEDGCITLTFDNEGTYYISATSREFKLVPPLCVVTVKGDESSEPGNSSDLIDDDNTSSDPDTDKDGDILITESGVQDISETETTVTETVSKTENTASDKVNSEMISPKTGETAVVPFLLAVFMVTAVGAVFVTLKLNKNEK